MLNVGTAMLSDGRSETSFAQRPVSPLIEYDGLVPVELDADFRGFVSSAANPILGWVLFLCLLVLSLTGLLSMQFPGITVQDFHRKVEARCLRLFLRRQAVALGVELEVPS